MKKKIFVITVVFLIVFVVSNVAVYIYSSINNIVDSSKLIEAIESEDIVAIEKILQDNPKCVNVLPTVLPYKLNVFLLEREPVFPISKACLKDNPQIVELLIEYGADVNSGNERTPLHFTYQHKCENWKTISSILIKNGARIDYPYEYGKEEPGILYDIVMEIQPNRVPNYDPIEDDDVTELFIYAVNNIDTTEVIWSDVGNHSIHYGRYNIVRFLLDKGFCNVNDRSYGQTLLMCAADDSTLEMVQLLLDYGADKSLKDSENGKTAYDYAMENGNFEMSELLKP